MLVVCLFVDDRGTLGPGCERKKTLVGDIKPPITVPGDEFATNLQSAEHMLLGMWCFGAIFESSLVSISGKDVS